MACAQAKWKLIVCFALAVLLPTSADATTIIFDVQHDYVLVFADSRAIDKIVGQTKK